MGEKPDDGRKFMPKLKCPYGNHRFADVPDVALRNGSELKKAPGTPDADYILECPRCHQKVALCIRFLHVQPTDRQSHVTSTQFIT